MATSGFLIKFPNPLNQGTKYSIVCEELHIDRKTGQHVWVVQQDHSTIDPRVLHGCDIPGDTRYAVHLLLDEFQRRPEGLVYSHTLGHYNSLVTALDMLRDMGVISQSQKRKALRLKNIRRGVDGILLSDERPV